MQQSALSRSGLGATQKSTTRQTKQVRPAQVYELKLQTQQIRQQITMLRSQLKRTEFQITSKTSAINRTFEKGQDRAKGSATIHMNTIPNLQRNIERHRNTLETLREQIYAAENDDRTSLVEELEEELKMTYCEYQRHVRLLREKKSENQYFDQQLGEAEFRASPQHVADLRASIKATREENASLRDKANAYQIKIEKINIEQEIFNYHEQKLKHEKVMARIEADNEARNKRLQELTQELNEEQEKHLRAVAELTEIVEGIKQKITEKLTKPPEEGEE